MRDLKHILTHFDGQKSYLSTLRAKRLSYLWHKNQKFAILQPHHLHIFKKACKDMPNTVKTSKIQKFAIFLCIG